MYFTGDGKQDETGRAAVMMGLVEEGEISLRSLGEGTLIQRVMGPVGGLKGERIEGWYQCRNGRCMYVVKRYNIKNALDMGIWHTGNVKEGETRARISVRNPRTDLRGGSGM